MFRILLDEHYTGLQEYLEVLGWNVETIQDAGLKGAKDSDVVKYAKEHSLLLVTQDDKSADIAKLLGVKHVLVSPRVVATAVDAEIREKYAKT